MRVWVVDNAKERSPENLVALLRELGTDLITELRLVKVSPYQTDLAGTFRRLSSHPPDVFVIDSRTGPADSSLRELLNLDVAVILVSPAERTSGLHALAEEFPVVFVSPDGGVEGLRLALFSALVFFFFFFYWQARVADLQ